ncbi:MAG TPA: MCE family protein [Actinophytocola sp.]|uniref:MCE family protein n=1 Tax=Actinophytocola sp. TaxID=1872138 RepID=UPI002DB98265|nr:MCE family protein [Actinophytocola sp.]HEU5470300.1 MCE family protein [Actinophytocola sp.]
MSTRTRNRALGLVFIVLLAALGALAIAIYDKAFADDRPILLHTDRVGNQLKANADVKVRGMVVGTVREVRTSGTGVDVLLAIAPDKLEQLPRNVSARLLPKTLFGQRYVSLVIPDDPAARPLAAGDRIQQDTSVEAIELEQALRDLLPVLQAVQPQKLASTLGAVSRALENRGEPLGETLVALDSYLGQLNPTMPRLQDDIKKFADTLATYSTAGPDIIDALSDLTTTSRTISEQRQNVSDLFSTLTTASGDLEGFLRANRQNIIGLADVSRPTLEVLARYSPELPCLFEALTTLKPQLGRALGVGTNEPGLHIELTVKPARTGPGGAVPPPRSGPRCYPTAVAGQTTPSAAPSIANTPEENRFLTELLAPVHGVAPADLPGWSSLLVGPLFRGAEVTLR